MPQLDLGPMVDRLWLRYRDDLWQHVRGVGTDDSYEPTHFLPMPPEVQKL